MDSFWIVCRELIFLYDDCSETKRGTHFDTKRLSLTPRSISVVTAVRARSSLQLSVNTVSHQSKAQSRQKWVKITQPNPLSQLQHSWKVSLPTRGEEVTWEKKENVAAECVQNLLQRRMNQWWQVDTNPCIQVCVCVFGKSRWLTVVLLLLICCVTQVGVYLRHKLSLWRRTRSRTWPNYSIMSSRHQSFHT